MGVENWEQERLIEAGLLPSRMWFTKRHYRAFISHILAKKKGAIAIAYLSLVEFRNLSESNRVKDVWDLLFCTRMCALTHANAHSMSLSCTHTHTLPPAGVSHVPVLCDKGSGAPTS